MANRVLIIDDVFESLIVGLKKHNYDVFYEKDILAEDVLSRALALNVEGIIVRSKMFFSREFLQDCKPLKWIARAGVGTDNIDITIADKLGIKVINADGANALTVAEHVLGMILGFLHKLPSADSNVRAGLWNREAHRGRELSSLQVGIVGYGHTGSALAQLLSGFNRKVLAYDKYKKGFSTEYVEEVDNLDEICKRCDLISYHVPLTLETQGMIHARYFEKIQRKPLIVNASRGSVLDVTSIVDLLKNGGLSGLILDVWPDEPPLKNGSVFRQEFDWLKAQNCVMFSPHVAGWSVESYQRISDKLLDNVLKFKGCA